MPTAGEISDGALFGIRPDALAEYREARDRMRSEAKPTKEEEEALLKYTGDGYASINRGLRDGRKPGETTQKLDALFLRAPALTYNTSAWRGVGAGTTAKLKDLKVGDVFTDKGFVSMSFDHRVAADFAFGKPEMGGRRDPGATIRVRLPRGTRVLPGVRSEAEVILPRGSRFRVVASGGPTGVPELEALEAIEK